MFHDERAGRTCLYRVVIAILLALAGKAEAVTFVDRVIGSVDPDAIVETIRVEANSQRLAYLRTEGCCNQRAVIDRVAEEPYSEISHLQFSPDGRHVVYEGVRDKVHYVVLDGQPGNGFIRTYDWVFTKDTNRLVYMGDLADERIFVVSINLATHAREEYLSAEVPRISPSGRRIANVAYTHDGRQLVVTDGIPGAVFDEIGVRGAGFFGYGRQPVFSHDERSVAFIARVGSKRALVLNGLVGKFYDDIAWSSVRFSPTDASISFVATARRQQLAVIGTSRTVPADEVMPVVFSNDGRRAAVVIRKGNQWFVDVDGRRLGPYDAVDSVLFNPPGDRVAWVAEIKEEQYAIIDGTRGPPYNSVALMAFSGDGRHVAYRGCPSTDVCLVNVDGSESARYDNCGSPQLSGDGTIVAFDASKDGHDLVVVNGKELPLRDAFGVRVSSAGRRLFFIYHDEVGQYFASDGATPSGPYKSISDLSVRLSSDGNSISFVADDEMDREVVVVNGVKGRPYAGLLRDPDVVWWQVPAWSRSGKHFAYVADGDDYQAVVVDDLESNHYEQVIRQDESSRWLADQQKVFAYRDHTVHEVDIELGPSS